MPGKRQTADRVGVPWVMPKPSRPAEIMAMVNEALGQVQVQVADLVDHVPRPGDGSPGH